MSLSKHVTSLVLETGALAPAQQWAAGTISVEFGALGDDALLAGGERVSARGHAAVQ